MSAVETPATVTSFARPLGRRLGDFAFAFFRVRRNRSDMRRLNRLSDWQLADIGLSRADLDYAWDCPAITGDPTLRLDELIRRRDRIEAAARRVA
jgi:uncharacterized protein YjiS (DUF1127 family)